MTWNAAKWIRSATPFWQTDTAVSKSSWGYTENQQYKQPGRLIDDLVDIVSKNGCLLLNVGPRRDGTIPDEDQAILREIGKWLKLNGEAIYGSQLLENLRGRPHRNRYRSLGREQGQAVHG